MVNQLHPNTHTTTFPRAAIALRQAQTWTDKQNWQQAILCYQRAIQVDPTATTYKLLGDTFVKLDQWQAAETAYGEALKLKPTWAEVYANLGTVAVWQQHWAEALRHYREALVLKPELTDVEQSIEQLWEEIAQSVPALQIVWQALMQTPDAFTAIDHALLGDRFVQQMQIEQAITCYHQAIALDSRLEVAYWNLATALGQLGNRTKMLQAYTQALNLPLDWVAATKYCWLGNEFVQDEHWQPAIECFERAIRLEPAQWQAYHYLGDALLKSEQWQAAVSAYCQSIALNSEHSWSHHNLGDALLKLERWDEAIVAYQRAIELKDDFHWSHYNLAEALAKLERWDEAIIAYRQSHQINPSSSEILEKLNRSLHQRAKVDLATASTYYQYAIEEEPSNIKLIHQAIAAQPNNPELYTKLSRSLCCQNKLEEAIVFNEIAIQIRDEFSSFNLDSKRSDPHNIEKALLNPYLQSPNLNIENEQGNSLIGGIAYIAANCIVGWLLNSKSMTSLKLRINDCHVVQPKVNLVPDELITSSSNRADRYWFQIQIPDQYLNGEKHRIDLSYLEDKLLGESIDYQFALEGNLDRLEYNEIAGWIRDPQYDYPVELDIYVNARYHTSIIANLERIDVTNKFGCGFSLSLLKKNHSYQTLHITLKNSQIPILGTPLDLLSPIGAINALYRLGHCIRNNNNLLKTSEQQWLLNHLLPTLINSFRYTSSSSELISLGYDRRQHTKTNPKTIEISTIVDVIIPVYKNYEVTKLCIESVLSAKNVTISNVIVINDRSPEAKLYPYLQQLADQNKIQLIVNLVNQGFVHSVNLGMMQNLDRDVVLLNSDAIVSNDWLDRLRNAVYSQVNIASATPISNHASIFSYPCIAEETSQLPQDVTRKDLDEICHLVNNEVILDVPTNHGFCCFLRRSALSEVGLFDEEKWGKGYGEEVDWSQRGLQIGWRHVAVPGVFVEHVGSQSFSEQKEQAIVHANTKLASYYPEFNAIVHDFIKADSLATYRRRIDVERLRRIATSYMLYVVHDFKGGSHRHIKDMSTQLHQEGCKVLCLLPESDGWVKLISFTEINVCARYNLHEKLDLAALISDLKLVNIFHVHIHSTISFEEEELIWQLAEFLSVPYDVTIHDYQFICPRITLTNSSGEYCGEPSVEFCDTCILQNGTYPTESVETLYKNLGSVSNWRSYFGSKLRKARKVFTPSQDTKNRILKYFPEIDAVSITHPENIRDFSLESQVTPQFSNRYRIAIIGGISNIKGYNILRECALYALSFCLPIEFIVFGYTQDDQAFEFLSNVCILGAFQGFDELKIQFAQYPCDIAAFFSIWPETYSYTLTEGLALGLIPCGFNLGAIAERIQGIPGSMIMEPNMTSKQIVEKLIELAEFSRHHTFQHRLTHTQNHVHLLKNYYGFTTNV